MYVCTNVLICFSILINFTRFFFTSFVPRLGITFWLPSFLQSSERSGNAGASSSSSGANCASSGSHHSKWRIPFRSGYSSNSSTNATRASSATRNQSQSPRVQPPPPPQAPSYSHVTDAFVKSLTDFNERPGGLQTQGLYRECGNRTTAESIRQRSKDGTLFSI